MQNRELYRSFLIHGVRLDIYYGYYEEYERERGAPIPIYPNFRETPLYTADGEPLVTQMQELCEYGESKFAEGFCVDCKHYRHAEDLIGICTCPHRKNLRNEEE